jgi:hypothetical protein
MGLALMFHGVTVNTTGFEPVILSSNLSGTTWVYGGRPTRKIGFFRPPKGKLPKLVKGPVC